jgi:hypothetical protein
MNQLERALTACSHEYFSPRGPQDSGAGGLRLEQNQVEDRGMSLATLGTRPVRRTEAEASVLRRSLEPAETWSATGPIMRQEHALMSR